MAGGVGGGGGGKEQCVCEQEEVCWSRTFHVATSHSHPYCFPPQHSHCRFVSYSEGCCSLLSAQFTAHRSHALCSPWPHRHSATARSLHRLHSHLPAHPFRHAAARVVLHACHAARHSQPKAVARASSAALCDPDAPRHSLVSPPASTAHSRSRAAFSRLVTLHTSAIRRRCAVERPPVRLLSWVSEIIRLLAATSSDNFPSVALGGGL